MDQLGLEPTEGITPAAFASVVVDRFVNRSGIFEEHRNIEDYIPEKVPAEIQSLWLFYVVQLDYAVRGRVLYPGAIDLFNQAPDFYSPDFILSLDDSELFELLTQNLKPRYPNEAVIRYKLNSAMLRDLYQGNPINIFMSTTSAHEVLERIYQFRGMGPKTGNLFFRSMVSFFGFDYDDLESVLPPVDIHDVRIAFYLGFIDTDEMTTQNILKVKELWSNAANEAGVNWMVFDRALWLLGSEGKPKNMQDILNLLQ